MSAPSTVRWLLTAVHRIYAGSGRRATYLSTWTVHRVRRIWRRSMDWLAEGEGFGWLVRAALLVAAAAILRKVVTASTLGVYHRVADGGAPWLLWGAASWWIVSAYRAGAKDWKPKRPAIPEDKPEGEDTEGGEQPAADDGQNADEPAAEQAFAGPPLPILPDLRIALARVGTPHAHLAVLATDIGTTPERVREALEKWEIPIEAVRMQGRGTSTGVKGGDAIHPALVPAPEDLAVVAAGQPSNNNSNNADEEEPVEGVRVVRRPDGLTVYDLADHHRRRGTVGH